MGECLRVILEPVKRRATTGEKLSSQIVCCFIPSEDGQAKGTLIAIAKCGKEEKIHRFDFNRNSKGMQLKPAPSFYNSDDIDHKLLEQIVPEEIDQCIIILQWMSLNLGCIEETHPDRKQRRLIKKAGKSIGDCYRLVSISHTKKEVNEPHEKTDIRQRYHMRRGHWRNLRSGKRVWVRSCYAGDKLLGTVYKDYALA